jgi:hypothetical protein
MIRFSTVELMDEQNCYDYLVETLHPGGLSLSDPKRGLAKREETIYGIERRYCTVAVAALGSITRFLERSGEVPIIAVV